MLQKYTLVGNGSSGGTGGRGLSCPDVPHKGSLELSSFGGDQIGYQQKFTFLIVSEKDEAILPPARR